MGMIRKTFSIATLGLVNWNSKAELLEREREARVRAEAELAAAEAGLDFSRRKRRKAEKRAAKAEEEHLKLAGKVDRRIKVAEIKGEAKGASRTVGWWGRRKANKAVDAVYDAVDSATEKVSG